MTQPALVEPAAPRPVAAAPSRRLLHPGPVAAGATLLVAAFGTDLLYWRTLLYQWNNFSGWLLLGGLLAAALAGLAFAVDLASRRLRRVAWARLAALAVAALLSVLNILVHSRDAYTAVVPQGIALSGVVALLLVGVGLRGWSLARPTP